MHRRYSSTGYPIDHAAFKTIRNALRALTRKLRKTFEESITKNPKAFWKYSKSQLKTHSTINALINPDGNIVHSDPP